MTDIIATLIIIILSIILGVSVGVFIGMHIQEGIDNNKISAQMIQHKCSEYNNISGKLIWIDDKSIVKFKNKR